MKTLIYFQDADTFTTSGIGRAMSHQLRACELSGVETTIDKNDSYDLAHINTYFGKSKKLLNKCKAKGIPVIVHGHSTYEDFRNSFKCWQLAALVYDHDLKYMYSRADMIIAPTTYAAKLIESYPFKKTDKILAISNGIDIKAYAEDKEAQRQFRERFSIAEGEPFVMGVGFPFQRKGIIDFFEVARSFPDIKFIWFGHLQRILTNEKIARAIRKRPKNAIMAGYCKGNIIHGAFQSATCLFFPSYEETEGIVVLEALASRCPLIIRDIGVYGDWLSDGVDCHKGKDNTQFANHIKSLLEKGEDPQILENGFQVAKARDLPIVGEQLKQAYASLLESKAK
ncbi:MAG: glycosyltransferase family 4 protein [Bacillota bacterium]|nr:glycosyltransferase family 4 protein [Bacillota bacterium]